MKKASLKVFAIPLSACFSFNLLSKFLNLSLSSARSIDAYCVPRIGNLLSCKNFVEEAFKAAEKNPILVDKFIDHAMEVDVDAISDGKQVHVAGIMQHIEEAGIHSGDSACSLPPISIKPYLIKEIENQTKKQP